jgi:protein-S-isoprenylcysteine O-methyltransferase Ste14
MFPPLIRIIVSLAITVIMIVQSRAALPGSYKRRAFATAAVAFGLLTLFNTKTAMDNQTGPWMVAALILVTLLLLISLVLLLLAWRSGEMHLQFDRVQQAVEQERERRGKEHGSRPEAAGEQEPGTETREKNREPEE